MRYRTLIYTAFLLIGLADFLMYTALAGYSAGFTPTVALVAHYVTLFIFIHVFVRSDGRKELPSLVYVLFQLLLIWNMVTIVTGALFANDYWDWKMLFYSSALFLLLPLALYVGNNLQYARSLFKFIIYYWFRYGFLLIPLALATNIELYSRLMIMVATFLLFIPYLKFRWQMLIIVVCVASIMIYLGFRSNILKIAGSLLILSTYYFRLFIPLKLLKAVHVVMFALPLVFLGLGISGTFNIFTDLTSTEYEMATQGESSENLAADTRTLLYVEVLHSLVKSGRIWTGEGATGKYTSEIFDYLGDNRGRYGSEVGFLNTLLYSGIIGVILYAAFLFATSYFAIYRSNNWLCKMLGLMIAFRWIMYFIEEFTNFDLNFFLLWVVLGMISSRTFRSLSDRQVNQFLDPVPVKRKLYLQRPRNVISG